MRSSDAASLWQRTEAAGLAGRVLADAGGELALSALAGSSALRRRSELRAASVLVRSSTQRAASVALLELDGWARRVVVSPPDLADEHLPYVRRVAEVDAIVSDDGEFALGEPAEGCDRSGPAVATEWVLFTSGTTGRPKPVVHTLASLTGAIGPGATPGSVWSTFYDVRRYGGLQILLRALLGGGSMLLSSPGEPIAAFLDRARSAGVSFLSGTPSHWRRALLSPQAAGLALADVRLSGETADQAILDRLARAFPGARLAHAFASTEAGVAFAVTDGKEGFPASWIGTVRDGVELREERGTLRIRSARTALRYLGDGAGPVADASGFVDTHDQLQFAGDRCRFMGRADGVINVGGLKVHSEEVEAVINGHPAVHSCLVKPQCSAMLGALVVAEVVLTDVAAASPALEAEIITACRHALAEHKVPAVIQFVPSLTMSLAGKLVRTGA